ncbi:MAG TPA: hypothetical protein VMY80_15870 [Anaerolineae bacterium]|nr:hypothetical protein [Anaerolineae bacterium]
MDARERFLETMRYGAPDHVPYVDEEVREETLARWYREGFPHGRTVAEVFDLDCWEVFGAREEVALDLYHTRTLPVASRGGPTSSAGSGRTIRRGHAATRAVGLATFNVGPSALILWGCGSAGAFSSRSWSGPGRA